MTEHVSIRLAGEPKGKGRPRFSRASGRAFTPAATASYEAALRYAAQEEMGERPPFVCPLRVTITAYMPIPKSWSKTKTEQARSGQLMPTGKPDWDNLAKCTDALNEVVWRDDSQIVAGLVRKLYSDNPALCIEVRPYVGD